MNILVGKCFGLGNAVMAVPMVRALATIGTVDVLLGNTVDDVGAIDVFLQLKNIGVIADIHLVNACTKRYDVAIMAIPFDGRWVNGIHYRADRVLDTRPRPEFSPELGFKSWKKHEVEYQIENAIELGFNDQIPTMQFTPRSNEIDQNLVYLGFGFKRDKADFWSQKHWGNERFTKFITHCIEMKPDIRFRATGNAADLAQVIMPIRNELEIEFGPITANITSAIHEVGRCGSYFGNDTGMMHVAASFDMPTFGLMAYENVATKNHPWCGRNMIHDFSSGESDPRSVAEQFIRFVWG